MGKATLYISIPMTVLVFLQFYSPQSAWVNRGVGGSLEGAGFTGTGTFSRPPGTFSFTNGNTLFYSFAAPFIIFFSLNSTKINRIILIASIVAMIFAIPLSISRALFFQVIISLFFMLLAVGRKPKNLGSILIFLLLIVIAAMGLSRFGAFQTATEAFTDRFESANEAEGGLNSVFLDRYLGGMLEAIKSSSELPFFGGGLGMGTNVGSSLLTGSSTFLLSEGEWGRLIGEMGPIMGMLIIVIRVLLTIKLSILGYKKVASGNHLPWLLLSFGLFIIPQGQWGQPTSLGFSTLVGGLIIASFRISK
jgi:ABC-type multidrug transport system fused ATPase/permease subunit